MNLFNKINTNILQIVLMLTELSKTMCLYETYFMEMYCSIGGVSNSKGQSGQGSNNPIIQMGKDSCNSVAILRSFKTEFPNNGKCEVTVKAPAGYGLIAVLKFASFRPSLPCAHDRDELIVALNKSVQFNISSSTGDHFATDINDNDIGIKFITSNMRDPVDAKGFEMSFTVYKLSDSSGICSDGYFDCKNTRCVINGLKCDQINNCGNNIDEYGCDYGVSSVWLLLAVSGWIFSGFNVIGIILWMTYQKYFEFNNLR